jgi:hypothetical protein
MTANAPVVVLIGNKQVLASFWILNAARRHDSVRPEMVV